MSEEKQSNIDEILDFEVGGKKIRDMTAKEFCLYALSKLNNIKAYQWSTQNLTKEITSWSQSLMTDEIKTDIIKRLRTYNLWP
ncbi:MAG: hypothetical protein ACYDBV_12505 [Nitrospiria bacterium]